MFKPGVNEKDVQMTDVLCDFCEREWTEDVPFLEGHRGRMMCGKCLTVAYRTLITDDIDDVSTDYECALCREADADRAELDRANEPGWRSPIRDEAAVCRRCVQQAADALTKDPDTEWARPG